MKQTTKNEEEPYEISYSVITSFGCAKCDDWYYRNGIECNKCPEGCMTCTDNTLCTSSKEGYFKTTSMELC